MKDEEINIAIAEACGWTLIGYQSGSDVVMDDPSGKRLFGSAFIPNYCHDLNEMREALQTLNYQECCAFVELVGKGCKDAWDVCNLTPRQLAEAFLRTVGKWKE